MVPVAGARALLIAGMVVAARTAMGESGEIERFIDACVVDFERRCSDPETLDSCLEEHRSDLNPECHPPLKLILPTLKIRAENAACGEDQRCKDSIKKRMIPPG